MEIQVDLPERQVPLTGFGIGGRNHQQGAAGKQEFAAIHHLDNLARVTVLE
jgi:hypothetical protein